jgi:hypothetical protein
MILGDTPCGTYLLALTLVVTGVSLLNIAFNSVPVSSTLSRYKFVLD